MTKQLINSTNTPKKENENQEQVRVSQEESKQPSSPPVYRFRFMAGPCKAEAAKSIFNEDNFDRGPGPIC